MIERRMRGIDIRVEPDKEIPAGVPPDADPPSTV
jgi:hypothetical protein